MFNVKMPLAEHLVNFHVFTIPYSRTAAHIHPHTLHVIANYTRVVPSVTPPPFPLNFMFLYPTYCNESCRICLRARTYIALAISPTTSTRPRAQAAAPNKAGPCDGALAGESDCFRGGNTPAPDIQFGGGGVRKSKRFNN